MDGYESFVNDDTECNTKGDTNELGYKGLTYSPDISDIIDNRYKEIAYNSYGQYIGAEVVLPYCKSLKTMGKVSNYVKYVDISTGKFH